MPIPPAAIMSGYGPAGPPIGPYWAMADWPTPKIAAAAASRKFLIRMAVSSLRARSAAVTLFASPNIPSQSPRPYRSVRHAQGHNGSGGRNRPLQSANRDFLEQSANFLQISPFAEPLDRD